MSKPTVEQALKNLPTQELQALLNDHQELFDLLQVRQRTEMLKLSRRIAKRWERRARPSQRIPDDAGNVLVLAGRGWGKTETGAQTMANWATRQPSQRIAMIGPTQADTRNTMFEGESGILRVLPPSALRGGSVEDAWLRSSMELYLGNGTKVQGFSAEKPGRLRGPNHHRVWADEIAAWSDASLGVSTDEDTTWTMARMTLRLPVDKGPKLLVTTTPKPNKLMWAVARDPKFYVVKGSSYENIENLDEEFRAWLETMRGTRLGRQEIEAELLDEDARALWSRGGIEEIRIDRYRYQMKRIVVAIDPQVENNPASDATGIIVAGIGPCRCKARDDDDPWATHLFVMEDCSVKAAPARWARKAVDAYHRHKANLIIAEKNQGGAMVAHTLHSIDHTVPVAPVHASRGKQTRAEPVSALYERGLVHHIGAFPELEDEMVTWVPGDPNSPDRMDALVWAVTALAIEPPQIPSQVSYDEGQMSISPV